MSDPTAPDERPPDGTPAETPAAPADPLGARFQDLAGLEEEIRRRLRSNQRFLEKFLDEDFVDDEEGGAEAPEGDDEEL